MPLILSKSAFTGHETLMLIRRIPAYSVPIAEVLQRRTRGHFSTGSPARERNVQCRACIAKDDPAAGRLRADGPNSVRRCLFSQ